MGRPWPTRWRRPLRRRRTGKVRVRILSVVVYDQSETTTSWNVALGIQAAVDGGATVLNLSLGGTTDSAVLDDIVNQALARGIVIFASAGNQPVSSPTYPAAIPGVNDVTALSQPGQLAAYANFSPQVDMALPGTSIFSYGGQTLCRAGDIAGHGLRHGFGGGNKRLELPELGADSGDDAAEVSGAEAIILFRREFLEMPRNAANWIPV